MNSLQQQKQSKSRHEREQADRRRQQILQSTAAILSRGVSLTEVQAAVKRLRPEVHQAS